LDYAADLEILIKDTGGKPILIGHSMGGLLAQILASRGLATDAVLLAPASPRGILALQPSVIKSFKSVLLRWAFWKTPIRQTFEEVVYSKLHLLTPEQQKKVYGHLVYESGRAAAEIGFWLLDGKRATEVDEKKVTCPMLIISGAEDRITPAAVVKQVHKKYKNNSTYIVLKNHAHWIMGEPGWEEVAKHVHDWLKRLP
jgi:pimeloyl-ACP methyl ester carboxylesterase